MLTDNDRIIYFAGKVAKSGGYRNVLFPSDMMSPENHLRDGMKMATTLDILYGGPTAISCDHGCSHGDTTHGNAYGCGVEIDERTADTEEGQSFLVKRCLRQIQESDGVFAFIDSLDCFGTLAEIGYAAAMRKPVQIVIDEALREKIEFTGEVISLGHSLTMVDIRNELWFVLNLPGVRWRFGLVPDFDESVFSRRCSDERFISSRAAGELNREIGRLRQSLAFIERETCRIADKGSAMWRELLTAVIVKPIREALEK
jgi:hypothetical protein